MREVCKIVILRAGMKGRATNTLTGNHASLGISMTPPRLHERGCATGGLEREFGWYVCLLLSNVIVDKVHRCVDEHRNDVDVVGSSGSGPIAFGCVQVRDRFSVVAGRDA